MYSLTVKLSSNSDSLLVKKLMDFGCTIYVQNPLTGEIAPLENTAEKIIYFNTQPVSAMWNGHDLPPIELIYEIDASPNTRRFTIEYRA